MHNDAQNLALANGLSSPDRRFLSPPVQGQFILRQNGNRIHIVQTKVGILPLLAPKCQSCWGFWYADSDCLGHRTGIVILAGDVEVMGVSVPWLS